LTRNKEGGNISLTFFRQAEKDKKSKQAEPPKPSSSQARQRKTLNISRRLTVCKQSKGIKKKLLAVPKAKFTTKVHGKSQAQSNSYLRDSESVGVASQRKRESRASFFKKQIASTKIKRNSPRSESWSAARHYGSESIPFSF